MELTPNVYRAVDVAAYAHDGQFRKGSDRKPFISHPFSVMLLASHVTRSEVTLCACLLNDVLEDVSPERYSESDMRSDFGNKITEVVKTVSKDESIPDWRKRSEAYLETLRTTEHEESLIVAAADKNHNLQTMLDDYRLVGEKAFAPFTAGKEGQRWWYDSMLEVLEERIPDNPLVYELAEKVEALHGIVD